MDIDLDAAAGDRLDDLPPPAQLLLDERAHRRAAVGAELADALHPCVGDEDLGLGPRRARPELDLVVGDELRADLFLEVVGERGVRQPRGDLEDLAGELHVGLADHLARRRPGSRRR